MDIIWVTFSKPLASMLTCAMINNQTALAMLPGVHQLQQHMHCRTKCRQVVRTTLHQDSVWHHTSDTTTVKQLSKLQSIAVTFVEILLGSLCAGMLDSAVRRFLYLYCCATSAVAQWKPDRSAVASSICTTSDANCDRCTDDQRILYTILVHFQGMLQRCK